MSERWLPMPDYEGLYEVSDLGRVRSLHARFASPRPVKVLIGTDGYLVVMLSKDGKRTPKRLHRLVCRAFHGESGPLKVEAAHLDGNRQNPRADNLKWATKVENHFHKRLHGTHQTGDKAGHRILTSEQVGIIRQRCGTGNELAAKFGVSRQAIYDIWQGRSWSGRPRRKVAP